MHRAFVANAIGRRVVGGRHLGKGVQTVGWSIASLAAATAVVVAVPTLAPFLYGGLALWTFRGDRQIVQSLTIAWLVGFLNPGLYDAQAGLVWVVIGAAALSKLHRLGPRRSGQVIRTSGLGIAVLLLLPSVLFSPTFELAAFKLASFAVGAFVVVSVLVVAPTVDREWLGAWFTGLFWFVVLASLPLIASELGYLRNDQGFQGILNHPQALGVFLAPFAAVFFLDWLTRGRLQFAGLGALVATMLLPLTQARVGMVAAAGGIGSAMVIAWLSHRGNKLVDLRRSVIVSMSAASILLLVVTLGYLEPVQNLATKGRGVSLLESFEVSRGVLLSDSIDRFSRSPIVGRGLGTPAVIDDTTVATVAGFPISAPVEAGFALSGILEQAGVLGLIGILALMVRSVWPAIRAGPLAASGLAVAAFLTNLGEATITSFGGLGLFVWLMMGWAVAWFREEDQDTRLQERSPRVG